MVSVLKYKKRILLIICVVITILYSPNFLIYSDIPEKSDVIVLFLGNYAGAREKNAIKMLSYSNKDKLLIPCNGKIINRKAIKKNTIVDNTVFSKYSGIIAKRDNPEKYKFYEATHIEVLNTKIMMEYLNINSAIIVSSPYHLRRIKIMVASVFKGMPHKLLLTPEKSKGTNNVLWFLSWYDIKWVVSEYMKIGWFLLYEPWVEN